MLDVVRPLRRAAARSIALSHGPHPIHFGITFIVNLELDYPTAPMGINVFVASTVFERSIADGIRGVVPLLLIMLSCLVAISWWPWLRAALLLTTP